MTESSSPKWNAPRGTVIATLNVGMHYEDGALIVSSSNDIREIIALVGGDGANAVHFDGETSVWAICTL